MYVSYVKKKDVEKKLYNNIYFYQFSQSSKQFIPLIRREFENECIERKKNIFEALLHLSLIFLVCFVFFLILFFILHLGKISNLTQCDAISIIFFFIFFNFKFLTICYIGWFLAVQMIVFDKYFMILSSSTVSGNQFTVLKLFIFVFFRTFIFFYFLRLTKTTLLTKLTWINLL